VQTEPESASTEHVIVTDVVSGSASGPALVLDEPLSLWGGLDALTGIIIDQRHPQRGVCISGTVVFMASGRGSSSASSVLAEAVRLGTAPVAFVLRESDEILALGSFVAEEMYGLGTPVVVTDPASPLIVSTGDLVRIEPLSLWIERSYRKQSCE
jgi:predicted aconitase with swiveling domain